MKKIKNIIMNFINGFCMALADSVPGVSGGTIAFLLGFYDEFISSLDDLFRGSLDKKKNALKFLIKIGIGWLIGFLSAATVLSTLFTTKIYAMSSLFIGFILFAIPIIIKEEITSVKDNYKNIIFTILGIILVVLITILTTNNSFNVDISKPNLFTYIYVFIAASIAITAMVLPGISGSTLLLVFGLYLPIMTSIKELLTFNFNKLPILIVFGLGVVIGIVF
jgi:putative membrane protein